MSNYTPDEVNVLIEMLRDTLPKSRRKNFGNKPILNKAERTIKYLEQRHKFFNPTKEMLEYIISVAENSGLDPEFLEKMREDLLSKK